MRYQISQLKNQLVTAYDYASKAIDYKSEKLAAIYDLYETILATNNALDFDDLLYIARRVLRDHENVRAAAAARFTHILVDEFQDTDPIQAEIIFQLAGLTRTGGAGLLWRAPH